MTAVFTVTANTPTVTVQQAWSANGNNQTWNYFGPGDTIHYMAQVQNHTSSTVTATFTFLATGPQKIFSWSGPGKVSPGTPWFYSPSTIPTTTPLGMYTLTVTVTYNGVSSSDQSLFTVVTDKAAHAIAWAESQITHPSQNWNGLCERFVEYAFGNYGGTGTGGFLTAQDAYNALPHSTKGYPDIGALVWFAPNPGNGENGHVGIYIGGNQFVSATYNGVQNNGMTRWSNNVAPYEGWGDAPANWPGR